MSYPVHHFDEYQRNNRPVRFVSLMLIDHHQSGNTKCSHTQASSQCVAECRDQQYRVTSTWICLFPIVIMTTTISKAVANHRLMSIRTRLVNRPDCNCCRSSKWPSWFLLISSRVFNYGQCTFVWKLRLQLIMYSCIFVICSTRQFDQDKSSFPLLELCSCLPDTSIL